MVDHLCEGQRSCSTRDCIRSTAGPRPSPAHGESLGNHRPITIAPASPLLFSLFLFCSLLVSFLLSLALPRLDFLGGSRCYRNLRPVSRLLRDCPQLTTSISAALAEQTHQTKLASRRNPGCCSKTARKKKTAGSANNSS